MAEKLYVVCEYGWEYDDNYYHQPDSSPADPIKAYRSKEKAEEDAKARNMSELREKMIEGKWGIAAYAGSDEGWAGFVREENQEALFKLFNEYDVTVTDKDQIDFTLPDEPLPDEFFEKLELLSRISWYSVAEIESELT